MSPLLRMKKDLLAALKRVVPVESSQINEADVTKVPRWSYCPGYMPYCKKQAMG